MKATIAISLFLAIFAPHLKAQATKPLMRDAATHDELALKYSKTLQADPMAKLKSSKGADPSQVNQPQDLVKSSDILCFNGAATLIPKKAILNMPKSLESRLKFLPGSKIHSWADFFTMNRGWITTVEVSRVQAEGNQPLDEAVVERVHKSMNLVVATYLGGPISVLPPKVPAENANPAENAKAATVQNANTITRP
jgi:hypothetical protein